MLLVVVTVAAPLIWYSHLNIQPESKYNNAHDADGAVMCFTNVCLSHNVCRFYWNAEITLVLTDQCTQLILSMYTFTYHRAVFLGTCAAGNKTPTWTMTVGSLSLSTSIAINSVTFGIVRI